MQPRRLALIIVAGALLTSAFLATRAVQRTEALKLRTGRLIYASSTYAAPAAAASDPRRLVDGDPRTAVADLNAPRKSSYIARPLPPRDPAWPWNPGRMFIQLQAGLTHFPGTPPEINALRFVRVWNGDQSSEAAFRTSARARRVRLIFFRQQIVDFDREYRLADEPVFLAEETVMLRDVFGPQDVPVTSLPVPEASSAFPLNVKQLWVRAEILDHYPGTGESRDAVAVSELKFVRERE